MDKLWKWIMHLNAKAFCLLAVLMFFATAAWCGLKYLTPPEPFKDGGAKTPELNKPWEIGTLNFVSNQLAAETLSIPTDPFRPTLEAIFTNETERVAFIKKPCAPRKAAAAGLAGAEMQPPAEPAKKDRFRAFVKAAVPDGRTAPTAPMVILQALFSRLFQTP